MPDEATFEPYSKPIRARLINRWECCSIGTVEARTRRGSFVRLSLEPPLAEP